MANRIVVDFNSLERISRKLMEAGHDIEEAASILGAVRPTQANGAYTRLNGLSISFRSIGGSVSASNAAQVAVNYRSAARRLSHYAHSLATGVKETGALFRQNEQRALGSSKSIYTIFNGFEYSREGFLPTTILSRYALKIVGSNWTASFLNYQKLNEMSLKSEDGFKDINKGIKEKLEKSGLREKLCDEEKYYKNGKEIDKKDAPTFYDRQATIAEFGGKTGVSCSLINGSVDMGQWGELDVSIGRAEAYAAATGGFYVLGANGEKIFSPGAKVECGASYTALEVNYKNQLLGDENLGVNTEVTTTVGKVGAKADVGVQVIGEDGKLDLQFGGSASAEVIGGEVSGKAAVNVLGGEVGVKGSVNYGVGAHADIGYRDGVFKFDVGASLGIGASVGAEIDIGGMVNTVADKASAAWKGISKGWRSFWGS